jgi:hypothetical protein
MTTKMVKRTWVSWVVVDKDGNISCRTNATSKRQAIDAERSRSDYCLTWKQLYDKGYRAVQVEVREL